jgi:plastocyanin
MAPYDLSQRLISYPAVLGALSIGAALFAGCQQEMDRGPVANLAVSNTFREALITGGEASAAAATESTGTGWATIRGQFVYDGTAPQPGPYKVDKEHNICSINGQAPPEETLVVDSASKGIKNVAIYLRDAKRVHESATAKEEPVVFDQKNCVFLTHLLAATVGQTIDIKNSDPTGHNTNILGTGFNQLIPDGGSIPYKAQKETAVPLTVKCSIHPWMVAHMLVRENNYYAVTDNEGRFEIANVPAGEPIEFQVWHESGAAAGSGLVGASPDATDLKWSNRGRVVVTLQPDEVKEIKVVVPPGAFRS